MALEAGQRKWNAKAAAAFRAKWVSNFASAQSFDSWCEGVAAATGLPKGTIASSLAGQNFRAAQQNAAAYAEKALRKIEAAARSGKWKANYVRAFQK